MSRLLWYPGHELLVADIVRAENCGLINAGGKRYVDLESGVWCTPVGHGNERVARVIGEQAGRFAHAGFCYSCEIVEGTAEEILTLLDLEEGKCVFLCSGSEAIEYGVRVAQIVSEKLLFLTMADSYFGAYGSAQRRDEEEWFNFDWTKCHDCPDSKSCDESCPRGAAIPFERIGGFLFEPGSSSGLVRFPPRRLIQRIVGTIRAKGGLVLVNEVTTGIGRTGEWFGYQHYGFTPDIVAMGKGVGNGYPVSVTAFSSEVIRRLGSRPVGYAQSHQNDPLGAAVVHEVVAIIEEDRLVERARAVGGRLASALREIQRRTGRIKEVRARGLMIAVELVDDTETTFTNRTHRELVRRGFIVGRRPSVPVLRIDPALTVETSDLEEFLAQFEEILKDR